ncbi:MAG: 16S rRNA (cytosine(967)-C(5))-methyltransferase [SAR86 cluster bacterium]|uniref:16S rRNA (cytosine(967)-C(5))-methyltransferase n=1 Tax=SAR86 cluster bacterium TaxID=2030880 RepID=A0A2A4MS39_9GAMM|nr:MAG: 16S rRNA (cytosine(967)-C(5))-methyltransferase [SAR86 cluster bacterium]
MSKTVATPKSNNTNVRALAAKILSQLLQQQGSLSSMLGKYQGIDDYSLLQELCFGSARWFYLLESLLSKLLARPLKNKDSDLKCLLIVGLYQLRELRIPDYAAINETVSGTKKLNKPWAKSLINGVLRQYLRQQEDLNTQLSNSDRAITTAHPQWFVDKLTTQWPNHWQEILSNNNCHPPMTLRINLSKISRPEYIDKLKQLGIEASPGVHAPSSVYLAKPCPVDKLPGFSSGELSVQDEASQLVPNLLALQPQQIVLDACAAPGGKTCHILESEPLLTQLTAIDIDARRLERINENLQRLQLKANLKVGDASAVDTWWDGEAFDRILVDTPCSATGVIRRHPDIKLLRTAENINKLGLSQRQLLANLWQCLKPDGILLYTSCSVLAEENQDIIADFLKSTNNAKHEAITADWGVECRYGRQLFPQESGHDGFYFCLIRKLG